MHFIAIDMQWYPGSVSKQVAQCQQMRAGCVGSGWSDCQLLLASCLLSAALVIIFIASGESTSSQICPPSHPGARFRASEYGGWFGGCIYAAVRDLAQWLGQHVVSSKVRPPNNSASLAQVESRDKAKNCQVKVIKWLRCVWQSMCKLQHVCEPGLHSRICSV